MLFNKAVYLPNLGKQEFTIKAKYSKHAIQQAYNKDIELLDSISFNTDDIFEIEVINGKITKVLVRLPYNNKYDVIFVIMTSNNLVKTVWLNSSNDVHNTLNKSKYAKSWNEVK